MMSRTDDEKYCSECVDHAVFGAIITVLGTVAGVLFAHNMYTSPLVPTLVDWMSVVVSLLIGVGGAWYCYRSIRWATRKKGS